MSKILSFFLRHKSMVLASIFFFYMGCGITLCFTRLDCENELFQTGMIETDSKIEYAVLILTGPENEQKRDAIRATWANFASNIFIENGEKLYKWNHTWTGRKNIQHNILNFYFAIGIENLSKNKLNELWAENNRSMDLLLLNDVVDNYQNLSFKILHAIKWINENVQGLKYLVKSDDDSFLRIDLIIRDLEAFAPNMNAPEISNFVTYKENLPVTKGLYWGYFMGRAKVFLNGKWKEKNWFLCNNYLPYALGGGYVLSRIIVDYIAKNMDYLSCYNSEDVSMGVWTAALSGINRVHDIRFDTEWKSRGCMDHMLIRHKQTPSDMFSMYKTLVQSQGRKLCNTEVVSRKSYHYNWNVLPIECCNEN